MCQPTAQLFTGIPPHPALREQSEAGRYNNSHRPRPMDIKVAMGNPQCLDPQIETSIDLDELLYNGPPTSPTTFSELNYTCTSPHGYTAAPMDPSLLTPVSSIASPPHQHRIIDINAGFPYGASEEVQHSSPASDCSNMLMQYDMGVTTQSPASITIHAPVTESLFDSNMVSYNMPASPAAEAPEPSQYHLGPYDMSEPQHDRNYHFSNQAVVAASSLPVGADTYGQRPLPSMTPNQSNLMDGQDSISLQPSRNISPTPYHQDFHGLSKDLLPLPTKRERKRFPKMRKPIRKPARKPDVSERGAAGRSSVSGPPSVSTCDATAAAAAGRDNRTGKTQLAAAAAVAQGLKAGIPTLVLKNSAPADLKRLLELRKEFNNDKGKGMWDDITKAYNAEFGTQYGDEHDRARLQMKLTRGINRYAELPKAEELRIIEAFEYDEKHKYERICARLAETGGSDVWPWKPAQIEGHLVVLGMEEKVVDEKNNLRRKRREAQRKRNAANAMPVARESVDGIMVEWVSNTRPMALPGSNNGSPNITLPSQAYQFVGMGGMRRPSAYDMAGAAPQQQRQVIDAHFFSNEDHDDVMKQLEQKYYANGGDPDDMAGSPAINAQHHAHLEHQTQYYIQETKREAY
ncbi:hypothetical protein GGTG_00356 [Gaeumannomyces tritici R3-111a-1]|uniref:Uncharacterized protein n=1 Tax=Gaeumannomyces tritici (strain R3-111a-1) TaxID=644352 RepID=J3NGG6_GAET3|nr:hypothetical protein GGTG_00356 [Gaeumannomyces tritici R3-111a-1]EJT80356.1 hypothetical protein GGTG_00356 [Gaeumannomyces tritici R3-111a-1]